MSISFFLENSVVYTEYQGGLFKFFLERKLPPPVDAFEGTIKNVNSSPVSSVSVLRGCSSSPRIVENH